MTAPLPPVKKPRRPVKIGCGVLLGLAVLLAIIGSCAPSTPASGPDNATPAVDPDLRPGPHHVAYTFGASRKLKGTEWRMIGLGWTNPGTGARELPPEVAPGNTKPLQFPYTVQFDVTDLHADIQHVAAGSNVGVPNLTVDCTITVDGQVLSTDVGSKAVMTPSGEVQTSGGSDCVPHR